MLRTPHTRRRPGQVFAGRGGISPKGGAADDDKIRHSKPRWSDQRLIAVPIFRAKGRITDPLGWLTLFDRNAPLEAKRC